MRAGARRAGVILTPATYRRARPQRSRGRCLCEDEQNLEATRLV